MLNRPHSGGYRVAVISMVVALAALAAVARAARPALVLVAEYKFAALESEVAGIYPHPADDALFLVAANRYPAYRDRQSPVLGPRYRGHLLTINRHTGTVVKAIDLGGKSYGGIAFGDDTLFVSSLEPPEILAVALDTGRVLRRIPLSGPAGGLEYDRGRSRLLAQLYVGFPHIAVVDPGSGLTTATLVSDESAMDLALVSGDLLCTWISSFDARAFGELRRIDRATGEVIGRLPLDRVLTSMAPLNPQVNGGPGFIGLARIDGVSGRVTVLKYAYDQSAETW